VTRVAVAVPTRGRAALARRAVRSFLTALRAVDPTALATIVVADDSDGPGECRLLEGMVAELAGAFPLSTLEVLPPPRATRRTVAGPGRGPGAVRNRALARLRSGAGDYDLTVMFDDDVCFSDVEYLGGTVRCDGAALLRDALARAARPRTVVGCGYVGRQDLSILEHIRLDHGPGPKEVAPSLSREGIDNVAPEGISTAFLAIGAPARGLPDFPEHYNEDYVWLHALRGAGWDLVRAVQPLAHVPSGPVCVTAPSLSFQVFGEIVWLAVLEADRFPVDSAASLAAAVDEIAGDLRAALAGTGVRARPVVAAALREVLAHYDQVAVCIRDGRPSAGADRLRRAIRDALALGPPA
jgi:hypothetical protein